MEARESQASWGSRSSRPPGSHGRLLEDRSNTRSRHRPLKTSLLKPTPLPSNPATPRRPFALLLGSKLPRWSPKLLEERLSQRSLPRLAKAPDCRVERRLWDKSRSSKLLRLESSAESRDDRLFRGRRRTRPSGSSWTTMDVSERRPAPEQSVPLPWQVQAVGQAWTETRSPSRTSSTWARPAQAELRRWRYLDHQKTSETHKIAQRTSPSLPNLSRWLCPCWSRLFMSGSWVPQCVNVPSWSCYQKCPE